MTAARPWMPLYVGDYLADTAHLRAIEHGAYLLLIMHYWRTGGLPDDDGQLSRVARTSRAEWKRIRPVIASLFSEGWKHKRIEFEMTEAARLSAAGKVGGLASAAARRQLKPKPKPTVVERPSDDQANDLQADGQALQSQSQKKGSEPNGSGEPPSRKKQLFDRGKEVLGPKSGGVIADLLRTFGKEDDPVSISKAFARIEEASTKAEPMAWIQKIMKPKAGEFRLMSGIEGVI